MSQEPPEHDVECFQIQILTLFEFSYLSPICHLERNFKFLDISELVKIHNIEDHVKKEFWSIYGIFPKRFELLLKFKQDSNGKLF
jgi:hypothetical protein